MPQNNTATIPAGRPRQQTTHTLSKITPTYISIEHPSKIRKFHFNNFFETYRLVCAWATSEPLPQRTMRKVLNRPHKSELCMYITDHAYLFVMGNVYINLHVHNIMYIKLLAITYCMYVCMYKTPPIVY